MEIFHENQERIYEERYGKLRSDDREERKNILPKNDRRFSANCLIFDSETEGFVSQRSWVRWNEVVWRKD